MDETGSSRDIGRTGARTWRTLPWFSIERWALAAGAAVLAALWIWTALTSNHSTRGYNDWLVILVLYAVYFMLATPRLVFRRSRGQRKPQESDPFLRRTTTYLVAFFGGIWILAFPVQYSEISRVAAITEIDGEEVAIISYNRVGPRGLLQMAFGMETQRVTAVDLGSGNHLWDVETSPAAFTEESVLGVDGGFVYVTSPEGIHALRLDDGSSDEQRQPSEEIANAWSVDDASPSGTENTASSGEGSVFVEDGILSVGDEDGPHTELGRVGADDIDTKTTIVVDPIVHRNSDLTVYDDGYGRELPDAVGAGYIVIQQQTYRSWGVYDYRISTVSLTTGRTIDEIQVPEAASGGMTAASGSSIVMLEAPMLSTTDLIMITPGGELSQSTIGRSGFFSEAL
ncbi:MAG: hypothetical protein ACTH0V_18105 [Microbacteriaceae bacterium]|uniref:hypothetical protein n=1 Tax=Microbacterium sp. TaxID=51671 RepID=UPI003F966588